MKKKVINNILILISFLLIILIEPILNLFSYFGVNDLDRVKISSLSNENKLLKDEIKDLNKLYNINTKYQDILYAKVIVRDIYSFYDEVIINKGSNDGVKENDAIISSEGLIGIVKKVNKSKSYVELISNKDLKISVRVNNSYGYLNKYVVNNINDQDDIKIGDMVYTSGLTNIYKDIYIGKVTSINKDSLGVVKSLKIKSDVNINNINYVGILR